jgi:cellulose biosynthesis protein BcsQ
MSLVVVFNLKGGVGKTTTVVNLAWCASQRAAPTLVWDLDPQASCSFFLGEEPRREAGGKRVLEGLASQARGTAFPGLDLIPGAFANRHLPELLQDRKLKTLGKLLAPLAGSYPWIWVDAPPTASDLALHLFELADILLVPLVPTPLSLHSYDTLLAWLDRKGLKKDKLTPFFNQVDGRKSLHRQLATETRLGHPEFLETIIPQAAILERMGVEQRPLGGFAPRHPGLAWYSALFEELGNHPMARTAG